MMKSPLKSLVASLLMVGMTLFVSSLPASAASGKIQFNISNAELQLGESTTVTISLDTPIICADPSECSVTLDFTTSIPAGITVTPSSVTWASSEWAQSRTITVAVAEDANELFGQTVSLGGTVDSGSEYYQGYQASFDVNVSAPVAYNQRTLANTGTNYDLILIETFVGMALVTAGLVVLRLRRRSRSY